MISKQAMTLLQRRKIVSPSAETWSSYGGWGDDAYVIFNWDNFGCFTVVLAYNVYRTIVKLNVCVECGVGLEE